MSISTITIRKLLQLISEGEVRIPAFQRDFVWEPDRVQFLMDSLYKGYPIGTLLLWRTKEKLDHDRLLGPYELPEPKKEYPIDYVLDGQQRITSIFATFQTELEKQEDNTINWLDIYFDINARNDVQDSQFIALDRANVKENHIPLKMLFDVTAYGKFVREFPDQTKIEEIDKLQALFKEVQIPIEIVETEEHSKIAIIFERVNRGGVPLDTYQLLSAWTWSGEFDLRAKFDELGTELDEQGYYELVDEPDLLLKCCAAVLRDDATSRTIIDLNGNEVRNGFSKFRQGILGAVDFLKRDCGVSTFKNIPYKSMIISLSRCFATEKGAGFHPNDEQRSALVKWFWHSCFSRRYSNSVDTATSHDIKAMTKLLDNDVSDLTSRKFNVSPDFFKNNAFSMTSVNTKIFILLLAKNSPLSFISGAKVNLESVLTSCNRTEFHHIFPKNYLKTQLNIDNKSEQFALANFAFLSQTDNRTIRDNSPTLYLSKMPKNKTDDIFSASYIPPDGFNMHYPDFINQRAKLLAEAANKLV
ncbi:DUF262 domain-containing protein [Yersinia enterocolitica]|uniref:GmrSD restriction endonuclease domain-containing protein n=1 Tax=Yersinia enterocolitica TaxID=630 RepID=UPI002A0CE850|nr:DUF262 domain-containing protein [Yersinia enterocolitica]EKN3796142.1 DUF262 domain-containing protein [Yersinia enterocolitica]EKN3876916.1 DUF262 domain-containing protein [Yersinia enterocolitica]EKN4174446.1 DUF262 domain-containing protein [Yersinia enterocolitica]ELY5227819.1 DUF262 domain-containing protein [Yersinia enterocolitica]